VLVSLIGGRLVKPWAILIAAIILNSMNNLIGSNATYQTGNLASLIMKFVYITGAYGFFYYRQSFGAALKRGKEK
jgi:hypothetical protein